MDWKFSGNLPVYQQIMEKIQSAVLAGEYVPGQKIPSVRDLAVEAQVNPNTMQHALQELERTKLLVTKSTSGRHVTDDPAILEDMRQRKLKELTAEYTAKFGRLGVSTAQVVKLLEKHAAERDEE